MEAALYARVSTRDKDQNPENQLRILRKFCDDSGWTYTEYVDQASAKDYKRRTQWQQLQKDARLKRFDVVVVFRLDRAFRSSRECANLVEDWYERGIRFKSINEDVIDTTTSMGRFILQIMAAVAELESNIIRERVRAGMERTIAEGKRVGRKPICVPVENIINTLQRSTSVSEAARELGVSRAYIHQELGKVGKEPFDLVRGLK